MTAGSDRAGSHGLAPIRPIARAVIEQQILDTAGPPGGPASQAGFPLQILEGPRGSGKTTLLARLAGLFAARGFLPVVADLERIAINAESFATRLTGSLLRAGAAPAAGAGRLHADIAAIEEELRRRRPDPGLLVDRAVGAPRSLALDLGRPVVLLLDELGEAARLCRSRRLKNGLQRIAQGLAAGPDVALVGSVCPASRPSPLIEALEREAGQAGRALHRLTLEALTARELALLVAACGCTGRDGAADLELWRRATNGHPLYAAILARRLAGNPAEDLVSALAVELASPFGGLHQELRLDYHLLVERSRGHAVVRTILELLAREEGANLSAVAGRLRITMPTALDYLSWLLEVGLIRRDGGGYIVADPLMKVWIALNGPEPGDPLKEAVGLLERPRAEPRPPTRPRGRKPGGRPAAHSSVPVTEDEPRRLPGRSRPRDTLIEID